jgi:hypothetical protein
MPVGLPREGASHPPGASRLGVTQVESQHPFPWAVLERNPGCGGTATAPPPPTASAQPFPSWRGKAPTKVTARMTLQ